MFCRLVTKVSEFSQSSSTAYSIVGRGEAGAYLQQSMGKRQGTPWTGRQSIAGRVFGLWEEARVPAKVMSKCAPKFFACANGIHCIIGRFRCNGFSDCPDGSDEENCTGNPLVCLEARFKCRNGRCVDQSFLCNGQDNCQDNSDEELCLTTA
ncbi:hypothetical protein ILYODFUR_018276, partial [Ilyodon furcidens]